MLDEGRAWGTDRDADANVERSHAFRTASLQSEVRRAWIVIGVVALAGVLVGARAMSMRAGDPLPAAGAAGLVVLCVLHVVMLVLARGALKRGRVIPGWVLTLALVMECSVPTWMMWSHIEGRQLEPYASLSSPPVLAYLIMLGLSTLRLRPWMCVLAGVVAGGEYLALLAYVNWRLGVTHPTTGLPRAAYVTTGVLLLISGIAFAWITREIRSHFDAALREAETRRRMGRLEHDLSIARTIQRALLPPGAPELPAYEIAGWNRPADQTGGDYYDWQQMPDGNWIVTLADVSGHGIGPAMVTAACRAYMRASTAHHGDLASLATRINRLLAADLPEGRFVTMASVLLNPAGGPVALLSAGHGPIVLYIGATERVHDLPPGNLPLAVLPDTSFGPAQTLEMKPGDILALITDGFVEWARHAADGTREEFGLARLSDSLRRHASLPVPAMIEAITKDVAAFVGGEAQQDDLTMVVIRRRNA